jgi:hypothetical protein
MPIAQRRSWSPLATLCAVGLVAAAQACSKDLEPTPITVTLSGIPAASEAVNIEILQPGASATAPKTRWLARVSRDDLVKPAASSPTTTYSASVDFPALAEPGPFLVTASSTMGFGTLGAGTSSAQFDGGTVQVGVALRPGAAVACDPANGAAACAGGLLCGRFTTTSTDGFCTAGCAVPADCNVSPLKEAAIGWLCDPLPTDATSTAHLCQVQCELADGGAGACPNGLGCGPQRGGAGHRFCEPKAP